MRNFFACLLALVMCAAPCFAADVSVTATSVVKGASANVQIGTAGATITAGQALYIDGSGNLQLAQADTATHAGGTIIALSGGATGQPVFYQTGGNVTFNAAFTKGIIYVVSPNNPGGIAPASDLSSGKFVTILGIATSTTSLLLSGVVSGISQ